MRPPLTSTARCAHNPKVMKIESVEAIAIRSNGFESAFVKIATDTEWCGWGEIQAPRIAPAACDIVHALLKPALEGAEFQGRINEIELLRGKMLSIGGCMVEAIGGVELALWDLAGKAHAMPVARLIAGDRARREMPAYVSGLSAANRDRTLRTCRDLHRAGFRYFEIDCDSDAAGLSLTLDALRKELGGLAGIAVNACGRLDAGAAATVAARGVRWIRDRDGHGKNPAVVQPRLGQCGLAEGLRFARAAVDHGLKIAVPTGAAAGPQFAGAVQFAAALPAGSLIEYAPRVWAGDFPVRSGRYTLPELPGLGIEIDEPELRLMEELSR
jgi:galactonate dehydratase